MLDLFYAIDSGVEKKKGQFGPFPCIDDRVFKMLFIGNNCITIERHINKNEIYRFGQEPNLILVLYENFLLSVITKYICYYYVLFRSAQCQQSDSWFIQKSIYYQVVIQFVLFLAFTKS